MFCFILLASTSPNLFNRYTVSLSHMGYGISLATVTGFPNLRFCHSIFNQIKVTQPIYLLPDRNVFLLLFNILFHFHRNRLLKIRPFQKMDNQRQYYGDNEFFKALLSYSTSSVFPGFSFSHMVFIQLVILNQALGQFGGVCI